MDGNRYSRTTVAVSNRPKIGTADPPIPTTPPAKKVVAAFLVLYLFRRRDFSLLFFLCFLGVQDRTAHTGRDGYEG